MFRHTKANILICIVMSALLFFVLSLPKTYQLTNIILKTYHNGPTIIGITVHSILFAVCLVVIKLVYFKLSPESFVTCDEDDYIMEPDTEGKYIDTNVIKSMYSQMGTYGCKWPTDPRYIPNKEKQWCMEKIQ